MNRIYSLIITLLLATIPCIAMETNNNAPEGQIVFHPAIPTPILERIKKGEGFNNLMRHISQGTGTGFHFYQSKDRFNFTGNTATYTIHEVDANTWVVTTGNNATYHIGYVIHRNRDGSFSQQKKSFFPCHKTTEQLKRLIASIDTASCDLVYSDQHKSIFSVYLPDGKTTIKMIVTIFNTNDRFFINTLYPDLASEANEYEHSDMLLAIKEIERKYSNFVEDHSTAISNNYSELQKTLHETDYERFNELLVAGANVNAQNKSGQTFLDLLLETKNDDNALFFATILLMRPESLNLSELLLTAIRNINQEAVQLLIAQDANVNYQDKNGDTPLHHCVYSAVLARPGTITMQNIVKSLLYAGADLNAKNNKGQTVADFITSKQYPRDYMVAEAIKNFEQEKNQFYIIQKKQNNVLELANLLWAVHTNNSKQLSDLLQDADRYYIGLAFKNAQSQPIPNTKLIRLLKAKLEEFEQQDKNNYKSTISNLEQKSQEELALNKIFELALEADNLSSLTNAELLELNNNKSLFCTAVKQNKLAAALELLEHGISNIWETNRGDGNDKRDALEIAYHNNNKEILTTLLNHGKTTPSTLHAVFIKAIKDTNNNNTNLSDLVISNICEKSTTELIKLLDLILQKETEDTFVAAVTQLKTSYEKTHPNKFTALLNTPYDTQHNYGKTLLITASQLGKTNAAQLLLNHNVDITAADKEGKRAIDCASNKEIRNMLVSALNPTSETTKTEKEEQIATESKQKTAPTQSKKQKSKDENALLIEALEGNNDKAVATLLKNAKLTILTTFRTTDNANPLMIATQQQNIANIKALINEYNKKNAITVKETIIDKKDNNGKQLFIYAFATKNKTIIDLIREFILHNNTEYEKLNEKNTQFNLNKITDILANKKISDSQKISNIKQIINNNKINLNTPIHNKRDSTILSNAIGIGTESSEIIKFLIENGADINPKPNDDWNALMAATLRGHLEIVKLLLEKGANVNAKDNVGFTALLFATLIGHLEIVKLLLDKGANVNAQTNIGDTALIIASQNDRHLEMVKLLIEKGANTNIQNKKGQTALSIASQNGHSTLVKILNESAQTMNKSNANKLLLVAANNNDLRTLQHALNKNADINAQNNNGATALIIASGKGHLDIVKLLLERGANINAQTKDSATALIIASGKGHLDIVKLLLERGANINAQTKDSATALIIASEKGHLDIVKLLLEKDSNINAQTKDSATALIIASEKGHLDIVKLLLEKDANINAQTKDSATALIIASEKGHLDIVKLLLEKDANINAQHNTGWTAVMLASHNGHSEIVKLLLERGANINAQEKDGLTALIIASGKGHLDIVKLLLERGANINAQTKDSATALIIASEKGHLDIVKLLLEKGANINAQHNTDYTALMIASHKGHLEIVKLFIEKGANVDTQYNTGGTALMFASLNGHLEIVKSLLEKGANINAQDKTDCTALMIASQNNYLDIVKLLLNKGANANAQQKDGWAALMLASENGHLEIVKSLLEKGTNINAQSQHGSTALMFASEKGHLEVIKLLIDKGANVDTQNDVGGTALMLASQNGHLEIVKLLLEKGASVNAQQKDGCTSLMFASNEGHLEIVKLFIEKGAQIDVPINTGETALMAAYKSGNQELIDFLISKGADTKSYEKNNSTNPLMFASQGGQTKLIKKLIKEGADVNRQNNLGNTALIYAAQEGKKDTVQLLLENGANIDLQNKDGKNVLTLINEVIKNSKDQELIKKFTEISKLLEEKGNKKAQGIIFS